MKLKNNQITQIIKTIAELVKFADDAKMTEQERRGMFAEFQNYIYYCYDKD